MSRTLVLRRSESSFLFERKEKQISPKGQLLVFHPKLSVCMEVNFLPNFVGYSNFYELDR